jgi:predicted dehydrogenase
LHDTDLHHLPVMPGNMHRGIGICGAGGIVNDAHLPAYRKAGWRISGIFDLDAAKAARTAAAFEIPRVYATLDELIADREVDIVDIAVPAAQNLQLVEAVSSAGKAMLIQKPLAEDLETARQTVELIERAGVVAAVNHQMRWEPGVRAARTLIERGDLGEIYNIAFLLFVDTPWHMWEWLKRKSTIDVLYHSIHYLDAIRFLCDEEPEWLFCAGATRPGYDAAGETRLCLHLGFGGELRATILTNHHAAYGLDGQQAEFRVEGTEGVVIRKMGLLMNYPQGVADGFRYGIGTGDRCQWRSVDFAESWFPDAFIGPMSSLMRALDGDLERPETDVGDNLNTLRLVFGAYDSMRRGEVMRWHSAS